MSTPFLRLLSLDHQLLEQQNSAKLISHWMLPPLPYHHPEIPSIWLYYSHSEWECQWFLPLSLSTSSIFTLSAAFLLERILSLEHCDHHALYCDNNSLQV